MDMEFYFSGPMDPDFAKLFLAVYGVILVFVLLAQLVMFLFRSIGLYAIAQRRRIDPPWLAWIPVGWCWVLGSLSDQYRYLVKDEIRSRRKLLLGFSLANGLMGAAVVIAGVFMAVRMAFARQPMSEGEMAAAMMGPVITALVIGGVASVSRIVEYVLQKICLYDLYRSCDRVNGVAYLILGILFPFMDPVFLFAVRRKDEGMPPRRPDYDEPMQ